MIDNHYIGMDEKSLLKNDPKNNKRTQKVARNLPDYAETNGEQLLRHKCTLAWPGWS